MKGNVRIFAYDVNSKIQNSPKVSLEQGIAKSGAERLRLNFFTKFKLWYFYWATVQKLPAFGNTQTVRL